MESLPALHPDHNGQTAKKTQLSENACAGNYHTTLPWSLFAALPLDPSNREFRVLRLLPGEFADEIRCSLAKHALSAPPEYEALSYTWGASYYRRTVTVNGVSNFPVTDNLFSALRRLRRRDQSRVLWIDAICINQDDIHERNSQVSQMGEIYRATSTLLVWLGDDDRTAKVKSGLRLGEPNKPLTRLKSSFVDAVACTTPRWSTRIWVLQEVVQAPYPPKFCFGPYELSHVDFPRLALSLAWGPADSLVSTIDRFLTMKVHELELFRSLDSRDLIQDFPQSGTLDLYDVVLRTKGLHATDPRDHIYSILGVAGVDYKAGLHLRIDYSIDVADLYSRATYYLIDITKALHILASAHHDFHTLHGMPTWAVDFRSRADIDDRLVAPTDCLSSRSILSLNQGHPSSEAHVKLKGGGKLLEVSGFELDLVIGVFTCEHIDRNLQPSELQAVLSLLEDLQPSTFCSPFTDESDVEVFRTELHSLQGSTTSLLDLMATIQELWAELNCFPLKLWGDYGHSMLPWLYFGFKPRGISLFVTRDGLIGFGSSSIQVGDVLALLYGSPGPAVVHPKSSHFEFRGFPHIPGVEDLIHFRFKHSGYAFVEVTPVRPSYQLYPHTPANESTSELPSVSVRTISNLDTDRYWALVDSPRRSRFRDEGWPRSDAPVASLEFPSTHGSSKLQLEKKRLEDVKPWDTIHCIPEMEPICFVGKKFVLC